MEDADVEVTVVPCYRQCGHVWKECDRLPAKENGVHIMESLLGSYTLHIHDSMRDEGVDVGRQELVRFFAVLCVLVPNRVAVPG